MLRPTIYIPSVLTKLLIPLAFTQQEAVAQPAGLLGSGGGRRPKKCPRLDGMEIAPHC